MNSKYFYGLLSLVMLILLSSFTKQEINKPERLRNIQEERKAERLKPGAKSRNGFTILLRFTEDRAQAENIRKRFQTQFNNEFPSEVVWHEPKFKVFAGAFLTRADAVSLLQKVRANFPNSMIVETKI